MILIVLYIHNIFSTSEVVLRKITKVMKLKYTELRELINDNKDTFSNLSNVGWFTIWLKNNLHIYKEFEKVSKKIHKEGNRKQYSVTRVLHELRSNQGSAIKVGNDCAPYLSRLVMLKNPELTGMFRVR